MTRRDAPESIRIVSLPRWIFIVILEVDYCVNIFRYWLYGCVDRDVGVESFVWFGCWVTEGWWWFYTCVCVDRSMSLSRSLRKQPLKFRGLKSTSRPRHWMSPYNDQNIITTFNYANINKDILIKLQILIYLKISYEFWNRNIVVIWLNVIYLVGLLLKSFSNT